MVCSIVFVMGFSTLTAKYYNELRLQKNDFAVNSREIQSILSSQNIALRQLFFNQILETRSIEERFRRTERRLQSTMSFLILNDNWEIIFENILEDVNFWTLTLPADDKIYTWNGIVYRLSSVHPRYGDRILFYERINYNSEDFFRDTLLLLIVVLIFSYFVYFVWYRFVGRNLLPVSENLDDMQAFIHNAGHELKTPLAVMRGNLQVMQAEQKFDEELLVGAMNQIDRMNNLIESLRELSEAGKLHEKSSLSLRVELQKVLESFLSIIESKNIHIENMLHQNFFISAHPYELQVFLSNLIKNAILYNVSWGSIHISQVKNIFEIQDTWKGISKKDQEKIFERFYRGESARNADEWFGIGLSLVKKIADNNGWKLEVESEIGKGSIFRVIF